METFSYRARTADGDLIESTWTAETEADALDEIREQGQFVINLSRHKKRSLPALSAKHQSLDAGMFFRQLAVLLQAGMQLRESLMVLEEEKGGRARDLLAELRSGVEHGRPFSDVLREHRDVFPPMAVAVAAVGEASGNHAGMIAQLADWMEQEARAREKMKTVLTYPLILFVETLAISCFLTLVVLPAFASLFLSMDAELPLPTRLLLDLSDFVQAHGAGIVIFLLLMFLALFVLSHRPRVRTMLDHGRLRGPVFGRLQREVVWMKTFRALSVLLGCAIPLDDALRQAGRVAGNRYIEQRLQAAADSVRQGFSLTEVFARESTMPHVLSELLRTGEAVGKLPAMFQEGSAYAAMMAENHAARLAAMAEPAAYLVIFALVGTMVAAVALPWLDMMTLFF